MFICAKEVSIIFNSKGTQEKGFSMIMILIIFAFVSILGITILYVVTSEHRFTRIDSRSQSAYYVAESGANYILSTINSEIETNFNDLSTEEAFFQAFETEFLNKKHIFDSFQENFGEQPVAEISVELENTGENYKDYKITSTGSIGRSERTVNSIITLDWVEPTSNPIVDDLLFYTKDFIFSGSNMYGAAGTSVSDGIETHDINGGAHVHISTMYFNGPVRIDGGSASFGNQNNPGRIYVKGNLELWNGGRNVYGDIHVKGTFRLKDASIHGDVYVDGNVELGWTPQIHQKIYYTGSIMHPNNYSQYLLNKCIKVDSVEDWKVPVRDINLRNDGWYTANGYEIKENVNSTVPDNARWLVDNYNYTGWPKWDINGDGDFTNVVIVSKENIKINTAGSFTGALIAPNGVVDLPQGGTTFNGVIVSKNGINFSGGGSTYNLKKLQEVFNMEDIPVTFNIPGESENNEAGNSTSGGIDMSIKTGIKEY